MKEAGLGRVEGEADLGHSSEGLQWSSELRQLFRDVRNWDDRAGPLHPTMTSDWMKAVPGGANLRERQFVSAEDNPVESQQATLPAAGKWVTQFWGGILSGTSQYPVGLRFLYLKFTAGAFLGL